MAPCRLLISIGMPFRRALRRMLETAVCTSPLVTKAARSGQHSTASVARSTSSPPRMASAARTAASLRDSIMLRLPYLTTPVETLSRTGTALRIALRHRDKLCHRCANADCTQQRCKPWRLAPVSQHVQRATERFRYLWHAGKGWHAPRTFPVCNCNLAAPAHLSHGGL